MATLDSGMDYEAPKLAVLHYWKKQHVMPIFTSSGMIKSRRIRRTRDIACMEVEECIQGFGGKAGRKETTKKS
jgi:hypothetical protein